jgi:hypothetical protein
MSVRHLLRKLLAVETESWVRLACYTSLISMALMIWSVLDPTPFPVMISMSIGQAIGTLALSAYLAAVLAFQLRSSRKKRARRSASQDDG